jgi:Glycosyl transferase family 2
VRVCGSSEGDGAAAGATPELVVTLDRPLPTTLEAGRATAVLVAGTCLHSGGRVEDLHVVVDGSRHRPAASGMLRDGRPSGFWATVPVRARGEGDAVELAVSGRSRAGAELVAPLGRIEVTERRPPPALAAEPEDASGPGLVAVCMATFEPEATLFAAQVESLKAQTDRRWVCLISDDGSRPEHLERIQEIVGDDRRFAISRSAARQGFYRNFERALAMVPAEAQLVALCDQDDRWYPDKLEALRAGLGSAQLVYSDQRLVDARGRVLRSTLWRGRRNNSKDLASMLVANTITGAATLFRRELVELIVPFPDSPGYQFHDHWLGLAALATGDVAYVDRPLYDYVQHAGAVFGDVSQGARPPRRRRLPGRRQVADAVRGWRAAYFYGFLAREVQAQTVLVRSGAGMTARKRRVLERFVACDSSPLALAWLAVRPARELLGADETLGSEAQLAAGILWRWVADASARAAPGRAPAVLDAAPPPLGDFSQRRLRRWRARV